MSFALGGMLQYLKAPLRPAASWLRRRRYDARYRVALTGLRAALRRDLLPDATITLGAAPEDLWGRACRAAPSGVGRREISLRAGAVAAEAAHYGERYAEHYAAIDQGREKALEHALTFALLDFRRVRRYCDVAAATSPIGAALAAEWPRVEYWTQDLLYATDVERRRVGGPAQAMEAIAPGFFDALTLHCSFEHFEGAADVAFLAEVDRILSPVGACLIVPLYLAHTHRVYLDPTAAAADRVQAYDAEAELRAVRRYRQAHGRFYSPETLATRVLARVPSSLRATLLRFRHQAAVGRSVYLEFGLVLHRPASVLRA
jgi:hypothetical protein